MNATVFILLTCIISIANSQNHDCSIAPSGRLIFNQGFSFNRTQCLYNPLRGFVSYCCSPGNLFPTSMENFYLAMKDLMNGPNSFTFNNIESKIQSAASRNHHSIIRVYVEYPGITQTLSDGVPAYLVNGLNYTNYPNPSDGVTPDYGNATLIDAMVELISELGRVYDGDSRIGFFQVGFLGRWGEWHTFPLDNLFPNTAIQNRIINAFSSAFKNTLTQLRYPFRTGTLLPRNIPQGYHDDSFAQDTIELSWGFYQRGFVQQNITDIWKSRPIGGEIRPEFMGCMFTANPYQACNSTGLILQSWSRCVDAIHPSWMWNFYAFYPGYSGLDLQNAIQSSLDLGYHFYIESISLFQQCIGSNITLKLQATISNQGIAPFYYPLFLNGIYFLNGNNATLNTIQCIQELGFMDLATPNNFTMSIDLSGTTVHNITFRFSLWSSILFGNQIIKFASVFPSTSAPYGDITVPISQCVSTTSFNSVTSSQITTSMSAITESSSTTTTSEIANQSESVASVLVPLCTLLFALI